MNSNFNIPRKEKSSQRRWRIVLYSHDTMGLGHKRRNLLIAQNLGVSALNVDILLITGTNKSNLIDNSESLDCITLLLRQL